MPAGFKKAEEAWHGKVSGSIDLIAKAVAGKAFSGGKKALTGIPGQDAAAGQKAQGISQLLKQGKHREPPVFLRLQTAVGRNRSDFSNPFAVICL